MRNRTLLLVALIGMAVVTFSLILDLTKAQQANGSKSLEVSPPSQEVSTDPGQTLEIKAKITNRSNSTQAMKVRIEDFTSQGEEGQISLIDKGADSVANWAKLDSDSFSLKSGESHTVTAKITIPQGNAGGRYGSFVFSSGGDNVNGGTGASINQEIASLFLIRISGDVKESAFITDFTVPQYIEFGPVPISLKFQNKGNIHVKPFGIINVTDYFGHKIADIPFTGANILPQASRTVATTLDKKLLIGPYTVTAILYYGSHNETLTSSTSFFAFPLRIVAIALVVLIIFFKGRKRISRALSALIGG